MELLDAMQVADLMKHRDNLLHMRERAIACENQGWAIKFNEACIPIPTDDKKFFLEAIEKALTSIESKIKKI